MSKKSAVAPRSTEFDVTKLKGKVCKVDGLKCFATVLPGLVFWNEVKGGGALTFTSTISPSALPYFQKLEEAGVEIVRFGKELSAEMVAAARGRKNTIEIALKGASKVEDFEFDIPEEDVVHGILRTVPAEGDRAEYTIARIHATMDLDGDDNTAIITFTVADAIAAIKAKGDLTHVEAFMWASPPPAAVAAVTAPADTL